MFDTEILEYSGKCSRQIESRVGLVIVSMDSIEVGEYLTFATSTMSKTILIGTPFFSR